MNMDSTPLVLRCCVMLHAARFRQQGRWQASSKRRVRRWNGTDDGKKANLKRNSKHTMDIFVVQHLCSVINKKQVALFPVHADRILMTRTSCCDRKSSVFSVTVNLIYSDADLQLCIMSDMTSTPGSVEHRLFQDTNLHMRMMTTERLCPLNLHSWEITWGLEHY